jgi:GH24 family phage-related lysozyme (muramidase)
MDIKSFVEELADPTREGCATWPYCDSRGYVTVGIGNLLATAEACVALPFHHVITGEEASDDEKRFGWARVAQARTPGASANAYRNTSTLRLTREYVFELAATRIERTFIPGIKRLCHDFDAWPEPAQRGILDMAYSLGIAGLSRFVNFLGACQARDFETAAKECHRHDARESRNAWTAAMFREAAKQG